MHTLLNTWGEEIRTLRKQKGLTMAELADRLGCDESLISRIETGQRGVSDRLKPRIAEALDVQTEELFRYEARESA